MNVFRRLNAATFRSMKANRICGLESGSRDAGTEEVRRKSGGEGKHKGSGPFAVRYETSPLFLIEEWAGRIRAVLEVQTTARGPQERTTL